MTKLQLAQFFQLDSQNKIFQIFRIFKKHNTKKLVVHTKTMEWAGTSQNHLEWAGTTWNKLEAPGTSWNYLEETGAIWNKLELPETSWNQLEQDTTNCNEMDLATNWHKNKKLIGETECAINISQ